MAADPIPTMVSPAEVIKYPQIFHPRCPPFLQVSKMSQFLDQISTPVVFKPPYFRTGAIYRKTKTKLSRTDDRPTITPNLGWVGPQLPEPLAQWVPQKVKVENFLYIVHSSVPGGAQRHQCYTTCWGRGYCKKATVPDLPIRTLQFTGGDPKL